MCCGLFPFWLAFGNLNNGSANGGLSYLNGNNGLSNANWNILARLSCKNIPYTLPHPLCEENRLQAPVGW